MDFFGTFPWRDNGDHADYCWFCSPVEQYGYCCGFLLQPDQTYTDVLANIVSHETDRRCIKLGTETKQLFGLKSYVLCCLEQFERNDIIAAELEELHKFARLFGNFYSLFFAFFSLEKSKRSAIIIEELANLHYFVVCAEKIDRLRFAASEYDMWTFELNTFRCATEEIKLAELAEYSKKRKHCREIQEEITNRTRQCAYLKGLIKAGLDKRKTINDQFVLLNAEIVRLKKQIIEPNSLVLLHYTTGKKQYHKIMQVINEKCVAECTHKLKSVQQKLTDAQIAFKKLDNECNTLQRKLATSRT